MGARPRVWGWRRAAAALVALALCPGFDGAGPACRGAKAEQSGRVAAPNSDAEGGTAHAEPRNVIFSSVAIGSSAHLSVGFKRALGASLDRNGFLLMGTVGAGGTRERTATDIGLSTTDHLSGEAALLLGHQWMLGNTVVTVLAGPEMDMRQRLVDGVLATLNRPSYGGRFMAEVWARPSEATLAVGTLIAGTAPRRLWGRGAYGWRVAGEVFVGPEAVVSVEEAFREARIGLHVTGVRLGRSTVNLSGGLLVRDEAKPNAYIGLTTHFRM